ncbi:metallophosphoesterase [Klebsiella sp. S69]|nr:metallophosphoesterase [Klebsiella sp. S69]
MKTLIGLGIPVVLLILSALAIWFVETRLIALFGLRKTLLFRCGFAGVYVAGLAGLILADKSASPLVGILYWLGGIGWIALVWLSLAFIVSGSITSFTSVPAHWAHGAALGTALTLTGWGIYSARDFVVTTTEIALPYMTTPLTIMHISDVHLGYHRSRDYLQKIVEATNRSQPDVVIINGDLLD